MGELGGSTAEVAGQCRLLLRLLLTGKECLSLKGKLANLDALTTGELFGRGSAPTMINRLLGKEDARVPVNHWLNYVGEKLCSRKRVEAQKATCAFRDVFRRSSGRRKLIGEQIESVIARSEKLQRLVASLCRLPTLTKREQTIQCAASSLLGSALQ